MSKTKSIIVYVLTGFVSGVTLCILLGMYFKSRDTLYAAYPVKFGDLKILVDTMEPNNTPLVIEKNGKIFFYAEKNTENKINHIVIVSEPNHDIRFTVDASDKKDQWTSATYGTEQGKGYYYLDKNYDGQFDIMLSDYDGKKYHSRYIFIEPNFVKVDVINGNKASNSDGTFIFDISTGWKRADSN